MISHQVVYYVFANDPKVIPQVSYGIAPQLIYDKLYYLLTAASRHFFIPQYLMNATQGFAWAMTAPKGDDMVTQ